jgi:septation ring formation regulator EzrA
VFISRRIVKRLGIKMMAVILLLVATGLAQTLADINSRMDAIQARIKAANDKLDWTNKRASNEASDFAQGLVSTKRYREDLLHFADLLREGQSDLEALAQELESVKRQQQQLASQPPQPVPQVAQPQVAQPQQEIPAQPDSGIRSLEAARGAVAIMILSIQDQESEEASRHAKGLVSDKQYKADLLQFANRLKADRQHFKSINETLDILRRAEPCGAKGSEATCVPANSPPN